MNLWGARVTADKAFDVVVPDDRDLLITRLALAPGNQKNPTVVSLVNKDEITQGPIILGTLRPEHCEQFEVDINVANGSSFALKVEGAGEVHFSGYYNRLSYLDDTSSYGSSSDDEYEARLNAKINQYMGGDDSSSGGEYEDSGNVESVSDYEISEEGISSKSPVKQISHQEIKASKPAQQQKSQPGQKNDSPKPSQPAQPAQPAQPGQPGLPGQGKKNKNKNKNKQENKQGQPPQQGGEKKQGQSPQQGGEKKQSQSPQQGGEKKQGQSPQQQGGEKKQKKQGGQSPQQQQGGDKKRENNSPGGSVHKKQKTQ